MGLQLYGICPACTKDEQCDIVVRSANAIARLQTKHKECDKK